MDWTWSITIASIVGTVANIHKQRWSFAVWLITNTAWAVHNLAIRQYPQAVLFAVYACLAVWGLWRWKNGGR